MKATHHLHTAALNHRLSNTLPSSNNNTTNLFPRHPATLTVPVAPTHLSNNILNGYPPHQATRTEPTQPTAPHPQPPSQIPSRASST